MFRSFREISENDGLSDGSEDQQLSIKDFHSGSHHVGIWGRNVLLTIPPKNQKKQANKEQSVKNINTQINHGIIWHD